PNTVFLGEADGLSQQLLEGISHWAGAEAEMDTLPAATAEQARALTRSAWGAGCTEISLLSHTLQMVLDRLHTAASAEQRQACVQA
ncbi:hypothetical protein Q0O86_13995, partial [Staphylococcus aureus]|nr:hypothetical protein [Staphylococcus aureus]